MGSCSNEPIGYLYVGAGPIIRRDPSGKQTTTTPSVAQPCGYCCCCPVDAKIIGLARNDIGDDAKDYNVGADLTVQIKVRFRPQAGGSLVLNSEDTQCRLFLWEYVEKASTATPPSQTPIGVWINRTQQQPGRFDTWHDFALRDPSKPCNRIETYSGTDGSRLVVKPGQKFTFWQYIIVTGGSKCNCKGNYRYLVRVRYTPSRPDSAVDDEFEKPYRKGKDGLPDEIFRLPTISE